MTVTVEQLAPLTLFFVLAILSWDIVLAGWMATRREAPRLFTQLTSICGILVAPALVIAVAASTESGARTVADIAWLLPLICGAFVLQVAYALLAGLLSPVVAIPILAYDLIVTAVATGDFLVAQSGTAPLALQSIVAARDVVFGMTIGRAALASPFAMLVPMIAPAYPARWRLSALARILMVFTATAVTTLMGIEWPRGVASVRSYVRTVPELTRQRTANDLALGLRLFPVLSRAPAARHVKADMALAAAYQPNVVLIVLDLEGTRSAALDSLARVLEPLRQDSVRIAVAFRHGRTLPRPDDAIFAQAVERILLRLKPAVFFPAMNDPMPSVIATEAPNVVWWQRMIRSTDAVRQRVRPATRLGVVLGRLDSRDSATYAWAVQAAPMVGVVGAVVFPSYSGMPGIDARLRTFERWHARATDSLATDSLTTERRTLPSHWLATVGGLPHAHGDASQLAAIQHALAWASVQPWIHAAIIGEAADYSSRTGLRAATGRIRNAWPVLVRDAERARNF